MDENVRGETTVSWKAGPRPGNMENNKKWKRAKRRNDQVRAEFRLNLKLDGQSCFPMKIKRSKPVARLQTFARSFTVRRIWQKIWQDSI